MRRKQPDTFNMSAWRIMHLPLKSRFCVSNVAGVKLCVLFSVNEEDKAVLLGLHLLFSAESSAQGGAEVRHLNRHRPIVMLNTAPHTVMLLLITSFHSGTMPPNTIL